MCSIITRAKEKALPATRGRGFFSYLCTTDFPSFLTEQTELSKKEYPTHNRAYMYFLNGYNHLYFYYIDIAF